MVYPNHSRHHLQKVRQMAQDLHATNTTEKCRSKMFYPTRVTDS